MNESAGANRKSQRLASAGKVSSLRMFLSPSAAGCSRPAGPTRLGPRRFCIQALTFRSISVSSATPTMMTVNTTSILMTLRSRKPFISGVTYPRSARWLSATGPGAGQHPAGVAQVGIGEPGERRPALAQHRERLGRGGRSGGARTGAGDHLARHPPGRPGHARLGLGLVVALNSEVPVHVGAVLLRHVRERQHQLGAPQPLVETVPRTTSAPGAAATAASSASDRSGSSRMTRPAAGARASAAGQSAP